MKSENPLGGAGPHQRRRAKITATVRQTLERSILLSIIIFFDDSGIKTDPFQYPFLWHKKTRPNTINKRLDGWYFMQKNGKNRSK